MRKGWMRLAMALGLVASLSGCFGYNKSAKRWAYAGNTVLILGGGGVIATDVLGGASSDAMPVVPTAADSYDPPFSGVMLTGAMLVTAGLVGLLFNATRPNVKTSR